MSSAREGKGPRSRQSGHVGQSQHSSYASPAPRRPRHGPSGMRARCPWPREDPRTGTSGHVDDAEQLGHAPLPARRPGHCQGLLPDGASGREEAVRPRGLRHASQPQQHRACAKRTGDLDAAEAVHKRWWRVMSIREKMLGSEHPATLMSAGNLAAVLECKGDVETARRMRERIRKCERKPEAARALLRAGLLFD